MSIVIYKIVRQGPTGLRFHGKDGTDFLDPKGLNNPQLAKILGARLLAYVRCEVGNGTAEVLGEAQPDEVANYEGRDLTADDADAPAPFKFPGR